MLHCQSLDINQILCVSRNGKYMAMMSLGWSNFASLKVGLEWQAERRFQASVARGWRNKMTIRAAMPNKKLYTDLTWFNACLFCCFFSVIISDLLPGNWCAKHRPQAAELWISYHDMIHDHTTCISHNKQSLVGRLDRGAFVQLRRGAFVFSAFGCSCCDSQRIMYPLGAPSGGTTAHETAKLKIEVASHDITSHGNQAWGEVSFCWSWNYHEL